MVRILARPNEIVEEVHAIGNDTLANRPGDVTILLKLAALELARKDFEPAVQHLEAARAASLTDLESRLQLATLYARFGRPELAGPVAEEAFKLAPDNPTALFEVGRARYGLGNFQPAVEAFAELSQQYPENANAHFFLGASPLKLGNVTAATAALDRTLQRDPNHLPAKIARGRVLIQTSQYELRPDDPDVADTYGWLLVLNDSHESGVAVLKDIVLSTSGHKLAMYHFAYGLEKLGRKDEAVTWLKSLLKSPEAFDGRDDVEQLLRALEG